MQEELTQSEDEEGMQERIRSDETIAVEWKD